MGNLRWAAGKGKKGNRVCSASPLQIRDWVICGGKGRGGGSENHRAERERDKEDSWVKTRGRRERETKRTAPGRDWVICVGVKTEG